MFKPLSFFRVGAPLFVAITLFLAPIGPTISAASTAPAVKKSINKICHAKGTRYYAQTKLFVPFKTLKDCLKSGGRLPKN